MSTSEKQSVLIVDDNKNFLKVFKFFLQDINRFFSQIDEAYNGEQAIAMTDKKDYDYIFMDIEMPVMDGIEATKRIKYLHPGIKIIALSLYNNIEFVRAMIDAGADEYLTKDNLDEFGLMRVLNKEC